MKALIIGANGFVGACLTKRLLKMKWKVSVFVRSESKLSKLGKEAGQVKIFTGNVTDIGSLKEAIKGIDVVFNCAAALPYHHLPDKNYWESNVKGVNNIMEVCNNLKVKRVVHISTVGIYGPASGGIINENSEFKISDVYSKTKLEGEKIVWGYIKKGFPATIIKPTIAYGPGDLRPGFLNLFVLISKNMFILVGKGNNYFHTIYIENLVDVLVLAATEDNAIGEDFIIGDYPCPTMKKIVKTIARVQGKKTYPFYIPMIIAYIVGIFFDFFERLGLPSPLNTRRVKFITQDKRYNTEKARKVLGYRARIGLSEGIKRTFDWYRKERLV